MRNTLCFAAVVIAGCAAPQASTDYSPSATSGASVYYCAKNRLNTNGGLLECNWQPTVDDACGQTKSSVLERASLASDPQPSVRCSSGVWLVKVAPR